MGRDRQAPIVATPVTLMMSMLLTVVRCDPSCTCPKCSGALTPYAMRTLSLSVRTTVRNTVPSLRPAYAPLSILRPTCACLGEVSPTQ